MRSSGAVLGMLALSALVAVGCEKGPPKRTPQPAEFAPEGMDLDRDGQPDSLLVKEESGQVTLSVRLSSKGSSAIELASLEKPISKILVCDYDGDGDLDVLFSHTGGGFSVYFIPKRVQGQPLFKQVESARGAKPEFSTFADLGPETYVMLNDGSGEFGAPKKL